MENSAHKAGPSSSEDPSESSSGRLKLTISKKSTSSRNSDSTTAHNQASGAASTVGAGQGKRAGKRGVNPSSKSRQSKLTKAAEALAPGPSSASQGPSSSSAAQANETPRTKSDRERKSSTSKEAAKRSESTESRGKKQVVRKSRQASPSPRASRRGLRSDPDALGSSSATTGSANLAPVEVTASTESTKAGPSANPAGKTKTGKGKKTAQVPVDQKSGEAHLSSSRGASRKRKCPSTDKKSKGEPKKKVAATSESAGGPKSQATTRGKKTRSQSLSSAANPSSSVLPTSASEQQGGSIAASSIDPSPSTSRARSHSVKGGKPSGGSDAKSKRKKKSAAGEAAGSEGATSSKRGRRAGKDTRSAHSAPKASHGLTTGEGTSRLVRGGGESARSSSGSGRGRQSRSAAASTSSSGSISRRSRSSRAGSSRAANNAATGGTAASSSTASAAVGGSMSGNQDEGDSRQPTSGSQDTTSSRPAASGSSSAAGGSAAAQASGSGGAAGGSTAGGANAADPDADANMSRLQALLEARGVPPHLFGALGPRMQQLLGKSMSTGTMTKAQQLLRGIEGEDENQQLTCVMELRELLVMGNEESLGSFPIKQAVPALIRLLRMEHNFDMMNNACRALTYLMEALPRSSAAVVEAIPAFLEKLQSIQCMDVAEQALTALEMLSRKHSKSILQAGGIAACLTYLDFFSMVAQRNSLAITANCCANVTTAQDFEYVSPSLLLLSSKLQVQDKKSVESSCWALARLVDNLHNDPTVLKDIASQETLSSIQRVLMESPPLISVSTFTMVIRMLVLMCRHCPELALKLLKQDICDTLVYLLVGSAEQSTGKAIELVSRSPQELFEIVSLIEELMPELPADGIFEIDHLLKRKGQSHAPSAVVWQWRDSTGTWTTYSASDSAAVETRYHTGEEDMTLGLNGVLYTIDFSGMQQINEDTGTCRDIRRAAAPQDPRPQSAQPGNVAREEKKDARAEALRAEPQLATRLIQSLFGVLYEVYSSSAGPSVKHRCLQGLLRMVYYDSSDLLRKALEHQPISSHIASMLASQDLKVIVGALQMAEILMQKLPDVFTAYFQRQGVIHQIQYLANSSLQTSTAKLIEGPSDGSTSSYSMSSSESLESPRGDNPGGAARITRPLPAVPTRLGGGLGKQQARTESSAGAGSSPTGSGSTGLLRNLARAVADKFHRSSTNSGAASQQPRSSSRDLGESLQQRLVQSRARKSRPVGDATQPQLDDAPSSSRPMSMSSLQAQPSSHGGDDQLSLSSISSLPVSLPLRGSQSNANPHGQSQFIQDQPMLDLQLRDNPMSNRTMASGQLMHGQPMDMQLDPFSVHPLGAGSLGSADSVIAYRDEGLLLASDDGYQHGASAASGPIQPGSSQAQDQPSGRPIPTVLAFSSTAPPSGSSGGYMASQDHGRMAKPIYPSIAPFYSGAPTYPPSHQQQQQLVPMGAMNSHMNFDPYTAGAPLNHNMGNSGGMGNPSMMGVPMGNAVMGWTGMGIPGMGNPGMGHPGMGNQGMGNPGMGHPGMGNQGMGNQGMGNQGMGNQGMGNQGMGNQGMGNQGMGHPGMGLQGMGHPGMGLQGMGPQGMGPQGMGNFGGPIMGNPTGMGSGAMLNMPGRHMPPVGRSMGLSQSFPSQAPLHHPAQGAPIFIPPPPQLGGAIQVLGSGGPMDTYPQGGVGPVDLRMPVAASSSNNGSVMAPAHPGWLPSAGAPPIGEYAMIQHPNSAAGGFPRSTPRDQSATRMYNMDDSMALSYQPRIGAAPPAPFTSSTPAGSSGSGSTSRSQSFLNALRMGPTMKASHAAKQAAAAAGVARPPMASARAPNYAALVNSSKEKVRAWVKAQATKFLRTYFDGNDLDSTAKTVLADLCGASLQLEINGDAVHAMKEVARVLHESDASPFEIIHSGLLNKLFSYLATYTVCTASDNPSSTIAKSSSSTTVAKGPSTTGAKPTVGKGSLASVGKGVGKGAVGKSVAGKRPLQTACKEEKHVDVSADSDSVRPRLALPIRLRQFAHIFLNCPEIGLSSTEERDLAVTDVNVTQGELNGDFGLVTLAEKVMACLHQQEQFQVKVPDLGGPGGARSGSAMRFFTSHQLKCQLARHPSCTTLRQWKGGAVKIEPLAQTQAIERYLILKGYSRAIQAGSNDDDDVSDDQDFDDDQDAMAAMFLSQQTGKHQLQFLIGDHCLPYNMTIYQAIRNYAAQAAAAGTAAAPSPGASQGAEAADLVDSEEPLGSASIWTQTHTIWYRPAPDDVTLPSQGARSRITVRKAAAAAAAASLATNRLTSGQASSGVGPSSVADGKAGKPVAKGKKLDDLWLRGKTPIPTSPVLPFLSTTLSEKLTITDPSVDALLLLRAFYGINKYWGNLYECVTYGPLIPLSSGEFVSSKLTAKANRQLQDPLVILTGNIPPWLPQLASACQFLLPFDTRQTLFYATAFDRERAMMRLRGQQSLDALPTDTNMDSSRVAPRLDRKKVTISRDNLLKQAEKVFSDIGGRKAVLEVQYENEVGTGLGPTLEFYGLISRELQRADLDLWRNTEKQPGSEGVSEQQYAYASAGLYPLPLGRSSKAAHVNKVKAKFKFLGRLMAKSLMDSRMVDIGLSPVFYRWLLGQEGTLDHSDLWKVDSTLAQSYFSLYNLEQKRARIANDTSLSSGKRQEAISELGIDEIYLEFVLPGYPLVELKKGGKDTAVTSQNLGDYLRLISHWTLVEGVSRQMEALREGFESVVPLHHLQTFYPEELDELFCGQGGGDNSRSGWSVKDLSDCCRPDHGYTSDSQAIKWLYELMAAYGPEERRRFLQFVTGSPRLPVGGFHSLTPPLTIVRKTFEASEKADDFLPSVMTCVNYLKLPDYSTMEIMKAKLFTAAEIGGFSFHLS